MNICNAQKTTEFSAFTRDLSNRSLTINKTQDCRRFLVTISGDVLLQKTFPKNLQGPFPEGHSVKICFTTENYCWIMTILPVGHVSTRLAMS